MQDNTEDVSETLRRRFGVAGHFSSGAFQIQSRVFALGLHPDIPDWSLATLFRSEGGGSHVEPPAKPCLR